MIGFLLLSQVSPEEEPTQPQMVILNGRRRGRPPASEPRSAVTAWLPASRHDALIKMANRQEMSVSSLVSLIIAKAIPTR